MPQFDVYVFLHLVFISSIYLVFFYLFFTKIYLVNTSRILKVRKNASALISLFSCEKYSLKYLNIFK